MRCCTGAEEATANPRAGCRRRMRHLVAVQGRPFTAAEPRLRLAAHRQRRDMLVRRLDSDTAAATTINGPHASQYQHRAKGAADTRTDGQTGCEGRTSVESTRALNASLVQLSSKWGDGWIGAENGCGVWRGRAGTQRQRQVEWRM